MHWSPERVRTKKKDCDGPRSSSHESLCDAWASRCAFVGSIINQPGQPNTAAGPSGHSPSAEYPFDCTNHAFKLGKLLPSLNTASQHHVPRCAHTM